MKTNKEYPATHSMSTAWYCVDEEGNVGVFEIEDNGPKPLGCDDALDVNDIWFDFSIDSEKGIKDLFLTPDQIKPLLKPLNTPDRWEQKKIVVTEYLSGGGKKKTEHLYIYNASWNQIIIKIDMTKLPLLLQAVSMEKEEKDLVCLSRDEGYFLVDFSCNQKGVELLESNRAVLDRFGFPFYYYEDFESDEEIIAMRDKEINRFPVFIYQQPDWPSEGAAKRMSNPTAPMKKEQLPPNLREQITQLPVKFKDTSFIQLAEYVPVVLMTAPDYEGDDRWHQIRSSNGEIKYYGERTQRILSKKEINDLIAEGMIDESDYMKRMNELSQKMNNT